MSDPLPYSPTADNGVPGMRGTIRFVPAVTVEPVGESPDVSTREAHPSIPDSPPTPPRCEESSLPLEEDLRSTHIIPEPVCPPYERLLSEGCTVRQKAPKSDAPIYSFRQDRVGFEFDHRRDHRGAATRVDRAVISVDEYCKYPVFDARSFRAVSPVVGLEVDGRDGWVNNKDRAETWNPSMFRICNANVQGLDVQEAHIRARSKSERAPMKTFMYVQNLELCACTPLVPGIFWPRKIQNFGAPGMNAGVRPKHERIRTNTFTYVQVLDVHGKY